MDDTQHLRRRHVVPCNPDSQWLAGYLRVLEDLDVEERRRLAAPSPLQDSGAACSQTGCGRSGRAGHSHDPGTSRPRRRQHDDSLHRRAGQRAYGLGQSAAPTPDGCSLKPALRPADGADRCQIAGGGCVAYRAGVRPRW